ncbi:uncharacterized protein LOC127082391 [Lathyrus oleraceus]|uniref:uncharacterized protein LOC127082391 n=1 Tax=Pisum sativum TaxID=3888 RepID=UPI0021CF03D7|nr:uncharacterized protein LOC127082391 [Pisum sativum]
MPSKKPIDASQSKKHEKVIDLEEERSDEEDDTLVHHLKPSVAKKTKTRKGKSVADLMTAKTSKKVVAANFTKKGGILGLTSRFLLEKAFIFAEADNKDAFEAIFALLIYGIMLFPNTDEFVDVNAIRIFLIGNPIPTLLGDTYHSIHHRTKKGGGTILCCASLLYKWFISHLPRSRLFRENPQKLRWSQRFMSIDQGSIHWYDPYYDVGVIIDNCGEFSNVPLLGVHGGINYNPILARRQLGYPMTDKPDNLLLSGFFYLNEEESSGLKDRIIHVWRNIHRKGKDRLGRKNCVDFDPYTQWVCARASEFKMPYALEKPSFPFAITSSSTIPIENRQEFQEVLDRLKLERDTWEVKLNHQYNTRASRRRRMNKLEQENQELRKEVITLKDSLERLTAMMDTLVAAQNQSSNNSQDPLQRTTISENVSTPIPMVAVNDQQYQMPPGFPWGMPHSYMPTGYRPQNVEAPVVTVVMFVPPIVVHTTPYNEETIFHAAPSCGSR